MRKPVQLNGNNTWRNEPRQQFRFYSTYTSSVCLQTDTGSGVMKILELYEKVPNASTG